MAQTKIGSSGLLEADLIIPQGTTFMCAIEHTDSNGDAIDHTGCTPYMRAIDKSGNAHDLGEYISFDGDDIVVNLPAQATASMPVGNGKYDIMIEGRAGDVVRVLYGRISIVDTYAMDE